MIFNSKQVCDECVKMTQWEARGGREEVIVLYEHMIYHMGHYKRTSTHTCWSVYGLWWKSPTACTHWNDKLIHFKEISNCMHALEWKTNTFQGVLERKLIHFKVSQRSSHNKIGIQITCDLENHDYCHECSSKIDAAIWLIGDSKIHLPILEWWCHHYPQHCLCQIIY